MVIVWIINVLVIAILLAISRSKGLERALPFVSFVMILIPGESAIEIPGLFSLTTQRIVLVVLIITFLFSRGRGADSAVANTTPLKWLILAHVGWCLISTANSVVPAMSIKKLLSQVFEYYLLYLIYLKTLTQVRIIQRIMFAMVAAVIVCSVFGTLEVYFAWSAMDWFPKSGFNPYNLEMTLGRGWRAQSTFPHAILFGAAIAMAIPLTLYLLSVVRNSRAKVFLSVGLLLMFLNIYKTMSRGPWLALAISLCLMYLLGWSKVRRSLLALGLLTATVLVVRPGVWETIKDMYLATEDPDTQLGASYEYRYALIPLVEQALAKNVGREMWGYGMESFVSLGLVGEFQGKPHKFLSCDSAWLELAIETGYIGFLLIVALLLKAALLIWRDFRQLPKPDHRLCLVLLVNVIVFYFMMANVALYSWGQNGHMLWMLIALSLTYGRLKRSETVGAEMVAWDQAEAQRQLAPVT